MAIERLQFRRGPGTDWGIANPVLADGEPGYDKTTGWVKYGDGVRTWADLPWANVGPQGPPGATYIQPDQQYPGLYFLPGESIQPDPAYPGLYTF